MGNIMCEVTLRGDVRLRRPEPRQFSVSLGVLVGLAGYLATPPPWPTDPVLGLGLGVCVALLAWTAVEQVPDALDRAAEARAYWLVAGLGLLPVAAVFVPALLGGPSPGDATRIRALVFALGAFVVATIGHSHRGMLLLKREEVLARVTAVTPRRREFALHVVGVSTATFVFASATGDAVAEWSVVGSVVGAVIGNAVTDTTEYHLVALDDHLLVRRGEGWGATAIPWRRLRGVSVDGDTLRVARGLPYLTVYEADLSAVEDGRAVLRAFRSYPAFH